MLAHTLETEYYHLVAGHHGLEGIRKRLKVGVQRFHVLFQLSDLFVRVKVFTRQKDIVIWLRTVSHAWGDKRLPRVVSSVRKIPGTPRAKGGNLT